MGKLTRGKLTECKPKRGRPTKGRPTKGRPTLGKPRRGKPKWVKPRGATLPEGIPVVEDLDMEMLEVSRTENFDMTKWHSACGTTHCRAGWAIEFSGDAGKDLEKKFGSSVAGALIYASSGSPPVPSWIEPQAKAIEDIKRRAGV